MATTELKQKLAATADKAKEAAATAFDAAKEAGRTARDEVTSRAGETMEAVRDEAIVRADAARDTLVNAGDRLAKSLHDSADEATAAQSRILSGIAGGVTSVTDSLRGRTIGDVLVSVQDFAKRNPGAFAAGAAVAGFALARFLRSSSQTSAAAQRAVDETSRLYHSAAQHSVDTLGHPHNNGPRS